MLKQTSGLMLLHSSSTSHPPTRRSEPMEGYSEQASGCSGRPCAARKAMLTRTKRHSRQEALSLHFPVGKIHSCVCPWRSGRGIFGVMRGAPGFCLLVTPSSRSTYSSLYGGCREEGWCSAGSAALPQGTVRQRPIRKFDCPSLASSAPCSPHC